MSSCFTWFPFSELEEPLYNINRFVLQDVDFTWRVSDCEKLVGVPNLCWTLPYAKVSN